VDLAKTFDARIRLISVVDIRIFEWAVSLGVDGFAPILPSPIYQHESKKVLDEKATEVIKKASEIIQKEKIKLDSDIIEGSPVEVLLDQSRLVDLLLMGPRGEYAKWSTTMMGTTVEAVTRQCVKPVLITSLKYQPIQKILAAYDGSANSIKGLQLSGYFADKLNAKIILLTIHHEKSTDNTILEEGRKYLETYTQNVETISLQGEASDQIVKFAEANSIDLIGMGAYGHSRVREAILGSNTTQVLRKTNLPVLLGK
jgi:nucleotide-binding universal stress UspA family protein